jgi:WD40 repeat protein
MSDTPTDGHLEEVLAAYMEAADAGWAPDRAVLLERYPGLRAELEAYFAGQDRVAAVADSLRGTPSAAPRDAHATLPLGDATPPAEAVLPRAFGDYEELEEIARGGMGVVLRARQKSLGRTVALKMILGGRLASPVEVQRFRNEAEAAALMDHPNIVPIYEIGEWRGAGAGPPVAYFAMKLVEGADLKVHLPRLSRDPRAGVALLVKVARAVHYAHQRGILHRDLKPANILLDERGEPHVTDFGLAKRVEGDAGLTQSGAIVGTPSYMAPEQAGGAPAGLTTAADVHALGAILYELLTGRPPFRTGNVLDTLLQVREAKPVPPRSLNRRVDADLETVCLKCLEKEPERRYGSAAALADDLERWLKGEPVRARRIGVVERAWKWARRRPGLAMLMGFLAVLLPLSLLLGAGYGITTAHLSEVEERRASEERRREEAESARATEQTLRGEAVAARESADQANRLLQGALYFNHVMRAHFEWKDNGVVRAEQLLEECPQDLRNWEWHYVKRLCHVDLFTLTGHRGVVFGVCFSADGKRLASASSDRTVRLWDACTGQEIVTLKGHSDSVRGVCFSPDGRRLASASEDRTVKVWDAEKGQEILTLNGHTQAVGAVCFSPDGQRLASASWDRTVKVWDAQTGREAFTLKGHTGPVRGVCFSPDGKRLASASGDKTVRVWDAQKGQEVLALKGHTDTVWGVCYSPDGKRLASASTDQTVRVWDAETGQEVRALKGHTGAVWNVSFSPNGKCLASASEDRTVRVWDAQTGQQGLTFKGHRMPVTSVCFSPDGKRLASAGETTVRLWDAETGQEARTLEGDKGASFYGVCFSPDSKRVAAASGWAVVNVWDAQTGQAALTLEGHSEPVNSVSFSPDGKRLATAADDRAVKVWDAAMGQEVLTLKGHTKAVGAVCFSPDSKSLASASEDGTVKVWDAEKGQEVLALKGHTDTVTSVCFSPDGQRLASASWDRTVKVWDAQTGQEVLALNGHTQAVGAVCFSPDGQRLASASNDWTVKVWDAQTGQLVFTLYEHGSDVACVCFSPDGRRLASASRDKTVKVWDAATGQEVLTLKGHTGAVNGVCFSPDGRRLASASQDGTVKLWDAGPLPQSRPDKPARDRE